MPPGEFLVARMNRISFLAVRASNKIASKAPAADRPKSRAGGPKPPVYLSRLGPRALLGLDQAAFSRISAQSLE